jgi:hypothetical protein
VSWIEQSAPEKATWIRDRDGSKLFEKRSEQASWHLRQEVHDCVKIRISYSATCQAPVDDVFNGVFNDVFNDVFDAARADSRRRV